MTIVATTILTMPTQKTFQFLIFMNLYQHTKKFISKKVISSILSDIVDLIILQSDCLQTFWSMSEELDFFQI